MSNIYIPPNCQSLEFANSNQVRLGLQGYPNTGKTWAALTFPNPMVLNLNRGLTAHQGRKDVHTIEFWKPEIGGQRHEVKDKLIVWLENEGPKLVAEQTLIVDGLSDLEIAYHKWFASNQMKLAISKEGKVNDFIEWQLKVKWFNEIAFLFMSFKCNVILICHESERADKPTTVGQPGQYTGKIRPLVTGATGDTIIKDYSDWFRCHVAAKPLDFNSISSDSLTNWGVKTKEEFKSLCDLFEGPTIYYWQTLGDDLFNAKSGSLVKIPKFIPATYSSFLKYTRKQTTN